MTKNQPRAHLHRHQDRQIEEVRHDPYHPKEKLPEPSFCPSCGAVYQNGRWQWLKRPSSFTQHACPACRRTHDRFPAGYVTLSGVFASEHHDELISLVRKEESREKSEHALQRIMEIRNEADQTVITTTGIRIAHKIADAVHQAYRGSLEVKFAPDEYRVRIRWSR